MADYGIVIHSTRLDNGELENKLNITITKIKDFNLGNPSGGEVNLKYDPKKYKLFEYTDEHESVDNYYEKKKPY